MWSSRNGQRPGPTLALSLILVLAVVVRVAWLVSFNIDPEAGHEDDSVFYHGLEFVHTPQGRWPLE